MAWAHHRGRLRLPCKPEEWLTQALEPAGIELLPVTPGIAARAAELTELHRDPFDRLIIATALVHDARLASVDGTFTRYPELAERLI